MPRLLQICNIGRIVGGTAACAWTVTRALPEFEHHILFLSSPDRETISTFDPVRTSFAVNALSEEIAAIRPDVILLHNTSASRIPERLPAPCVLYLHSRVTAPAAAEVTICCSRWLARQLNLSADSVLWQAVPKVEPRCAAISGESSSLIVGRLCTPQAKKWPRSIVPFYAELATRHPRIRWEFVGCPSELQARLAKACGHRTVFHPAGWEQRSHLSRWDVLLYSNPAVAESFGRTAAEAMRAGCVPVVDRCGGFVEQIPPECGFLCESFDEFDHALRELSDPNSRQTLSARAQQHSDENFSLEQFAADLRQRFAMAIRGFIREP